MASAYSAPLTQGACRRPPALPFDKNCVRRLYGSLPRAASVRERCSHRILVASSGDRSGTSAVVDEGHVEPFVVSESQVDLDTMPTTGRASIANRARPLRTTTISHFQLETSRATRHAGTASSSRDTGAGDTASAPSTPAVPVATLAGAEARAAASQAAPAPPAAPESKNTRVSPKYRPFLDAWDKGFEFDAREVREGAWLQVIHGSLPQELYGTYFRNGPGRFRRGPDAYRHPHDGDGLVASVAIRGGKAFFRSAFVRTQEYAAEEEAGRLLFRGRVGSQRPGGMLANAGDLTVKGPANAGLALRAGRLLALSEGGLPYSLDPYTLSTLGPEMMDGALKPGLPLSLYLGDKPVGPLVREALGNMHHAFGANDHLPRERLAPGGDACASRPRTCTHTGRLCYWSHRAVVRGLDALAPGPRGTRSTAVTFWEEEPVERSPREGWEEVGWQAELVAALVAAEAGAEEGVSAGASSDSESGSRVGGGVREVGLEGMVGSAGAKGEEEGPSVLAAVEGGHDGERAGAMDEEARLQELLIQAKAAQQQAQRSRLRRPRRLSRRVVLPGGPGGALSDVAVTENYYVLLQPPVHQEALPYLLGEVCAGSSVRWRAEDPAVLHVIPRPGSEAEQRGEQPLQLPLHPPSMVLRHVNAFEVHPGDANKDCSSNSRKQWRRTPIASASSLAPAPTVAAAAGPSAAVAVTTAAAAAPVVDGTPAATTSPPAAPSMRAPGSTLLVIDGVHYDSLPSLGAQPLPEQHKRMPDQDAGMRPRLRRLVVDLTARTVTVSTPSTGTAAATAAAATGPATAAGSLRPPSAATAGASRPGPHPPAAPEWHVDQPTINPACAGRKHRYVYGVSAVFDGACQGLIKVDMETNQAQRWSPGSGYFCQEPSFVPRLPPHAPSTPQLQQQQLPLRQRSEDDGWLLALGFDSLTRRSELLVFDAWSLAGGPVARVALPGPLPHGLYGMWADGRYFGPAVLG